MTKLSIDRPILVCNFKTYLQAIGPKAVKLATYADEVSKSTGIQIILTPFISDISEIVKTTDLPIFAQHLDYAMPGKNTGHILPEAMKDLGIKGTLINHIEKPLKFSEIEQTISRCNQLDLVSCLCSNGFNQSEELAKLNPDIMIIELPELIGTGKAISTANPEIISKAVENIRKVNQDVTLIAGSGITNSKDIEKAIELGMQGVGSSNAVVSSTNPKQTLEELALALLDKK